MRNRIDLKETLEQAEDLKCQIWGYIEDMEPKNQVRIKALMNELLDELES